MQIFHIPTTVLLNLFLIFSTEISEFCCFYDDIAALFNSMVLLVWNLELKKIVLNEDFYKPIDKEFETPEEQKYFYDNASLKPVIMPFLETLKSTSNFKFTYFLGDSEFDSYENFGFLKQCGFEKIFIPLNPRNQGNSKIGDLEYDVEGIPLCPLDKTPFKADGPCADKKSGRMTYVYPGVQRNSKELDNEYPVRALFFAHF